MRGSGLPAGTVMLAAVRFMLYLGVQASYFIGIIGTLTYELDAPTGVLALAVGLFNLAIIAGNAAGGALLDLRGPAVHTALSVAVAVGAALAFQLLPSGIAPTLAIAFAFGLATGMGFAYLSSYPAYLTSDPSELKRVNALLSTVSNLAVVVGPAVGGLIASVLPAARVFLFTAAISALALVPAAPLVRRAAAARSGTGARPVVGASPDAAAGSAPACGGHCDGGGDADGEGRVGTFADSARTVFKVPSLALLFWVGVLAYAGYGAFDPLESLYYRDVLHVDISWMGWLSSAAGVGSVVGALAAARVPRRWVNVRTLMLLIAFEGAACLLYVGTAHVACAVAGQVLLGAAFGMVTPLQNTLVQMHAPLRLLGRVNSVMNAGFNGAGVVPLIAAPLLARVLGAQGVLVAASAFVLIVPVACLVVRRDEVARLVDEEASR